MQDVKQIRNTVILGHGNSGKTTLAEALLYNAGVVNRLGKVDDGTAAMDFEPEETKRKITIGASTAHVSWKKNDLFLIDTPGDDNFVNETANAVQVADSAVLTIGAVLGVRNQTERFVDYVLAKRLPRLIAITKMDRERANFTKTINEIRDNFSLTPVILHAPIGEEQDFRGVVDLVDNKAWFFAADNSGKVEPGEIPQDLADELQGMRESLMEQVAETDDDLIEVFLEEGELTVEQLKEGLVKAVHAGMVTPVSACSALNNKGATFILDAIADLLPSPDQCTAWVGSDPKTEDPVERKGLAEEPFSALVFKTTADPFAGRLTLFRVCSGTLAGDDFYNASKDVTERHSNLYIMNGKEQTQVDKAIPGMIVAVAKLKETTTGDTLCDAAHPIIYDLGEPMSPVISYAVNAKKGDEEKLFSSISRMLDEDRTLKLVREAQTHETLLSGVGQVHLEVIKEKIKRKFGVEIDLSVPKVPYRETIKAKARVQGKHKKQSGGRGQFGDCWIEIEPLPRGGLYEFLDEIVGGVIPQQYRPAVDKGIQEAMEKGVIAGYPFVDIRVHLVDGSYHSVDSSEMAFKVAGSLAFKKAVLEASPVLLEPIMSMKIMVGKDHVGDVMGDLNSRRGKVLGMDSAAKYEVIEAQVPQSEILLYALDLTSMTGGRGTFSVAFSHYEEVPKHVSEKIIAASGAEG